MRTILHWKIPERSVTKLIAVLLLAGAASLATACDDEKDYSRREHIEWSDSPDFTERFDGLNCFVKGSQSSIFIKANVEYTALFETDEEEEAPDWFRVVKIERGVRPGIDELQFEVDPHPDTYKMRKGCLSLLSSAPYLNEFIPVTQGFTPRVEGDFDFLKYGAADPLETRGEVAIDDWTTEQKDKGWESTPAETDGKAYCYGKNGYIKLGDDAGHGANLLSPYKPDIRADTAAMVRFNAVAYAAADGTKDHNTLTVTITGGGEFLDGTTSKTITVNHLDPAAEELPTAMWNDSQQEFIIVSHPKNLFTSNTRVELMAGDRVMPSGNTRIFIDNFYIFRLRWYDYDPLFGGLPWEKDKDKPGK